MKRQTPFKLAAKAILRVTERDVKQDKNLLNTLKGGNSLHRELTRAFDKKQKPQNLTQNQTFMSTREAKQRQRNQQQALTQEVAALDNFVGVVSKQKTRQLIENIKLRRRDKHLQAFEDFKEQLQDYRQNLYLVYNSLESDLQQVLSIKENQLRQYLASISDSYLLNREKQFLGEVQKEMNDFEEAVQNKLKASFQEMDRIRLDRKGLVSYQCKGLFDQLLEIAFVLEDEARGISEKEKNEMEQLEEDYYGKIKGKLQMMHNKQKELFTQLENRSNELQQKWKQLNEEKQIQKYLQTSNQDGLRWPEKRVRLYEQLIRIQLTNSQQKGKLISNLAKQHPDVLSKLNVDKWNEHLKIINSTFDNELDGIVKKLMDELAQSEKANNERYDQLRGRLNYIERRKQEEVENLIQEKCKPNFKRNCQETKELLKQVTNYVQGANERENQVMEKLYQFLLNLGKRSDDFLKKWGSRSQEYQLEKAKILDQDDEVIEKLQGQLNGLKQQLREALHHIKMQEVQKACFEKIDELQKAYRKTHQSNKETAAKRPDSIGKFMDQFEAQIAQAFSLYDQSKSAELAEMAKKQCEQKATKRWQQQQRKRQEQQALALEQTKKKGGKPPPAAKPKDPKKAQAEMQERKKVLVQEIGLRQIEEMKTGSGAVWLAYRSLVEICSEFYNREDGTGDVLGEEIKNYRGESLVTRKALVTAKEMSVQLEILRNGFFEQLGVKKGRVLGEAQKMDVVYLQQSLTKLDSRLRQHYPMKGKLQAQVGVVRSGQITSHKKQYQKQVRIVKQKMDLQTQKFNYLLERCLQLFKDHNVDQKSSRENLGKGKTLADFQGCYRKAHENYKFFSREMEEIGRELSRLSSVQVEAILNSNQQFLKKSKLLSEGGEFSGSELQWYRQMMTQINTQITQQKEKRGQKSKEVQEQSEKRSKELIDQFDKEYNNYLDDLSAREGTGKKYGKPKRIAQEKLRFQMNKCEQAQINIDKQIDLLVDICRKGGESFPNKPVLIDWRKKLITLQTCVVRYGRHIEAIVMGCKARVMPRVTRLEGVSDALLSPQEQEQDKKRLLEQLSQLGPLSQQKQDKVFLKFVEDIEKMIGDEARAVYVGDKAKYITGNDKLPDYLRLYIYNMRNNAEEFRQESVRHFRQSCNRFAGMAGTIVELFFNSVRDYFGAGQETLSAGRRAQIEKIIVQHGKIREEHLHKLRPNLSHPDCQKDLKLLDEKQQKRQQEFVGLIKQQRKGFEDEIFANASQFLYSVVNNYEMLMLLLDSVYLPQDFVKVSGDDAQEKVHLDVKRLMLMKQKGIMIDANSQRNIKRKWEGVNCTVFNFGQKKFVSVVKVAQEGKEKEKKGGKKDPKAKVEEVASVNADVSKVIETFKTWRQKAVFTSREETIAVFSKQYQQVLGRVTQEVEVSLKENESFKFKWQSIAKTLYIS